MARIHRQAMLLAAALLSAVAAAPAAGGDTQGWSALAISGPVQPDSRFLLWFDSHARFRDDSSELGVTIARPGVGWRVGERSALWLGYGRITNHLDGPNIGENRIWQQATFPLGTVFGGSLSNRTRLEQRFREDGADTGHRLRQFLRWARPLTETFSAVAWNELFIGLNTTDWGQRDGFDQNRLFAGGAWHIKDKLRLELGYLNNRLGRPGDDQTNHNVSLSLFLSL